MKSALIVLTTLAMLGACLSCGAGGAQGPANVSGAAPAASSAAPEVPSMAAPHRLAVGSFVSCVINELDQIACWGPGFGRSPVVVSGADPVLDVDVGRDVCAVTRAGKVTCWSSADTSQPGPTFEVGSLPVRIAVGDFAKCALLADRTVACWAGLGTPGLAHRFAKEAAAVDPQNRDSAPAEVQRVPGLDKVLQIEADTDGFCALREGGAILCWTDTLAFEGELAKAPLPPAKNIGFADHELCAVAADGGLSCMKGASVIPVEGIRKARQICSQPSRDKAYSLDETGTFYEWSTGGVVFSATKTFKEERHFDEIGAGFGHHCAILQNRSVACWGESSGGRLGLGRGDDQGQPMVIPDLMARRADDDKAASSGKDGKGAVESLADVTFRSGGLAWTLKDAGPMDWEAADRHCRLLTLAGGGFRLPTKQELVDLYHDDSSSEGLRKALYWSSSPAGQKLLTWSVDFENGLTFSDEMTKALLVRCVH